MKLIKKHKGLFIFVVVVLVVALVAFFVVPRFFGSTERPTMPTQENTVTLSKMDLTNSISATGTLESAKSKTVSANVTNIEVKSVKVEEGDEVVKGQTLVTFDESDLKENVSDAEENLADVKEQNARELSSAKRKVTEAQETYTSQKEELAEEVKDAKEELAAAKKTVKNAKDEATKAKAEEALSQAEKAYEQAVSQQKSGNKQNKNSIQTAKDSLESTKSQIEKNLKEAEKNLEQAEETLEDCAVIAPMDGTVTAVGIEAGDTYSGGDMIEISDCTNLQVSTTVSEYDIANIQKGQRVVILTEATGEEELEGEISYVALTTGNSLSSGSVGESAGASGMTSSTTSSGYEVIISLTQAEENLRIGMTAKCSIILEEAKDVYAVPYDAIHTNTNGDTVLYVKDSGSKKEVVVTKGMESDYYVEVSGEELKDSLQIIIPTDAAETSSSQESESSMGFPGMMGGGGNRQNMGGGSRGGGMPSGGMPGM